MNLIVAEATDRADIRVKSGLRMYDHNTTALMDERYEESALYFDRGPNGSQPTCVRDCVCDRYNAVVFSTDAGTKDAQIVERNSAKRLSDLNAKTNATAGDVAAVIVDAVFGAR